MAKLRYKRRIYLIDKKFQFKYLFMILGVMFITVISVWFTTFYVVWDTVIKEFSFIPEASVKLGDMFVRTTTMLVVPIILLTFFFSVLGILFSHKIAGPIYRVEKVAEELKKGNLDLSVRFRKGDELQHLALSLNNMIQGIRGIVKQDKNITDSIVKISGKLQEDMKKNKGLKKEVKVSIKKLNTIAKKLKRTTDKFKV